MPITKDNITGAQLDTLVALVEKGPLYDGDVPSKSGRDDLIREGFAAKIVVMGDDGWQAATYRGKELYCACFNATSLKEARVVRLANRAIIKAQHS